MIRRVVYGPPNWVVTRFAQEDRMVFGFWTFVGAAVGSLFWGRSVLWVTIISVVALIPNFASETPVEIEGQNADGPAEAGPSNESTRGETS